MREITYLSQPTTVSMGGHWFELASMEHFWIRRRFEVFRRLGGSLIGGARKIAEIDCGHGLLQRQVEDIFGRTVEGFDLNEVALQQNLSTLSPLSCYDISQRDPGLRARFDLVFLFDVLEHIEDDDSFLKAALFHIAPMGFMIINVPAVPWAYSAYDEAVGHKRRYSIRMLRNIAARNQMQLVDWCYWGLPLMPVLIARSIWTAGKRGDSEIIAAGFDSQGQFMNRLLGWISRCEPTPQKLFGSSLMAILRRQSAIAD